MWKVCISEEERFQNVEKIFPLQQRDVGRIVDVLSKDEAVEKVIIFGSSVTSACNPWSDIDIYMKLREEKNIRMPKVGVPTDVWTNFDVDDRLMAEINEKGVVVYDK